MNSSEIETTWEQDRIKLERLSISIPECGCMIWIGSTTGGGYGNVKSHSRRALVYAHRLSWEVFNKKQVPTGMHVLHHCDTPSCINPRHLFFGTHKDNMQDSIKKHRNSPPPKLHGEACGRAKLSEKEALNIKMDNRSCKIIAEDYGIHRVTVWRIKARRTWGHQ